MKDDEYIELTKAIEILNKYRNFWHTLDWRHQEISNLINDFLPRFSNKIEDLK